MVKTGLFFTFFFVKMNCLHISISSLIYVFNCFVIHFLVLLILFFKNFVFIFYFLFFFRLRTPHSAFSAEQRVRLSLLWGRHYLLLADMKSRLCKRKIGSRLSSSILCHFSVSFSPTFKMYSVFFLFCNA